MNKVFLIGRLTDDVQLGYTSNTQKAVGKFRLAVDRIGEGTDFIPCVVFGKQAESLEKYVKKGNKLAVSGRLQTGSYEKDGQKVFTTDVIVENSEFIEPKRENTDISTSTAPAVTDTHAYATVDMDIPF